MGEHPSGPQAPEGRPFWEVHGLDPGRRAFRRLELYPNGTIVTEIIWDHEGTPVGHSPQPRASYETAGQEGLEWRHAHEDRSDAS